LLDLLKYISTVDNLFTRTHALHNLKLREFKDTCMSVL